MRTPADVRFTVLVTALFLALLCVSSRFSFLRSEISVSTDIFQRLCYTGVILSEPKSSRSDFSASMSSKVDSIGGDRYVVNLSVAVYSPPAL